MGSSEDYSFFIADAHCDALSRHYPDPRSLSGPAKQGHFDLSRALSAGVGLQIFAVFVDQKSHRGLVFAHALELIEVYRKEHARPGSRLIPGLWREDIQESTSRRGQAVTGVLSVEGGEVLEGSLSRLRQLFSLGVRCLGLTWNYRNELADAALDERPDGGLSPFGREVVSEMNRLGMAVDVSHLSTRAFWELADLTAGPFIASHSSARALFDHPRNLDDRQLVEIGRRHGFVGVNFCPEFLAPPGEASIDTVTEHIAHIASKAGAECVGLGSDFDGISSTPAGLEGVEALPSLAPALERVGFSRDEIKGILGQNLVRVLASLLPPKPDK